MGLAYLLYFALIASAGASRAILVAYLIPAFALVYGAVLLDEPVTAVAVAGLGLVLAGTALATGARPRSPPGYRARGMSRFGPLLALLAAVWGASYLFIKVAVEGGLEPSALMCARAAIAAALLLAYVCVSLGPGRAVAELRGSFRRWAILGVVGNAVPFWLVAWGEKHIDSGIAAVAQATVPLFTVLIGLRFLPEATLGRTRLAGFGLGLVGVAALAGGHPAGGMWAVIGTLAVVLSSLAYATGNVIGQRSVTTAAGPVLAAGAMVSATVTLAPFALVQLPERTPDGDALLSLLALAVLGTAVAQLVLYRMLRLFDGRRVSLVTYLMPGFALVYGAVLLDEEITAAALAGLALILAGVALGSGALRGRIPPRGVTP